MMQLIMPEYYGEFVNDRAEMHRLRYRAFKQRLDWTVEVSGDMEVDEFDVLRPVHLLNRSGAGQIQSCVWLLPSTRATMLRDAFPILLDGQPAPRSDWIWRAADSRSMFPRMRRRAVELLLPLTCCLRAFGLSIELIEIVTVTDARMGRILRRAGWPLRRVGKARPLGNTTAVAGYLEVPSDALDRIRKAQISGPVLWAPVIQVAA
ncbi:acyl-homoserine-lactone synthase [Bradyrhizobium sp. 188]|uniref:acyl-homoserine-lactone synthase n=1 Tax=Bradyrhizobium sp. 188 TaxID=2782656 RepID=UPI001FF9C650|nr:acyl-homoserine-lactone synthase [Bradyrhizobium sp. 188]MCK1501220.1 conjugal transfer protein TraI [Bradyrhizobium sp. 188]